MTIQKIGAEILRLHFAENWPVGRIAHKLGVHHSTVERVLDEAGVERKRHSSILDPYLPFIRKTLDHFPTITVAQLFDMVAERGYPGGFSHFRHLLLPLRLEITRVSTRTRSEMMAALWILRLLQGGIDENELKQTFQRPMRSGDVRALLGHIRDERLSVRNRAVAIIASAYGIRQNIISTVLLLRPGTVRDYVTKFEQDGIDRLFQRKRAGLRKHEDPTYKSALFSILHSPPASHGLNRTTWRMVDLVDMMKKNGTPASKGTILKMLRGAGYGYRKSRVVLTSTDPEYKVKLKQITDILSTLKPNEKFFSVDEFGPFAIKTRSGKSLTLRGHGKTVPQNQKSKGSLIIVAALELSTNQITHFYARKKDTDEMIQLLEILISDYIDQDCIYFSWDAASWHASKKLYEKVDEINSAKNREKHSGPFVRLAPLPASAQFLNVIESVFSGMARAILHNSDYGSVMEAVIAIDRHFEERNSYYRENLQRAGNKIWGLERVVPEFSESNNCKDPKYR